MNKYLSFIIFFLILPASVYSGSFRHLGVKDGLSSRQVFRVSQDSTGFVWAFTYLGVDRYDGNEIRHYKLSEVQEARDHILSSTMMTCDRSGNMWISLKSGKLYAYDRETDTFNLEADLTHILSPGIALNDIFFDSENRLWLCLSNGIYYFNKETKGTTIAGLANEYVNRLIQLEDGSFVAGSNTHLYRLRKDDNANTFLSESPMAFPIKAKIESLYTIRDKILVGTFSDGAYVIDIPTGKVTSLHQLIPSVPIRSFAHMSDQTVLVGTDGSGVYQLDIQRNRLITRYLTDEDDEGSLGGNTVSDILVDKRNCVWVSTYTNGISYLDPDNPKIHWIRHGYNNPNSLVSSHINAILEDSDGDMWYATNNGISLYQPSTNKWSHFLANKNDHLDPSFVVLSLCEDNNKNVWAGGYGIGVFCIDKKTGKVQRIRTRMHPDDKGVSTDYVYAMYSDGDYMYFGGIEGVLTRYDTKNDTYVYYPYDCIGHIQSGSNNTLIMAGCEGLGIFDKNSGEITWYNVFGDLTLQYPVRYLIQSATGDIWLGTDGNGLICFNLVTKESKVYTTDEGLDSNSINGIVEDNAGNIWFNTEKELYCLDLAKDKIIHMNEILDIGWGHYNPSAFIKQSNGDLVAGTADGVFSFSPSFNFDSEEPIELIFTDFKLLYQSVQAGTVGSLLERAINETSVIKLGYAQNSFSIAFSSINFVYPHKIIYEYKLDNFNNDWESAGDDQSIDYMNLPPGKYTFRLKAIDKYSYKEMGERSLDIVIGRPFWASLWAIILYIVIICIIVYLSVQFVLHKIKAYNSKEKIRSFISIAHDIRTPITLIKAPLSELQAQEGLSADSRKALSVAAKNAEKLFDMVTQLLDLQKADLHPDKINESPQNIYRYMEDKVADFRTATIQKGIELKLDIEPDFPEIWFDKSKMNKVLDNLLSNALKYTEEGSISIAVKHNRNKWTIEIQDTGIGIPTSEQKHLFSEFFRAGNAVNSGKAGSGIGLLLVQKIVKQLHGQISFTSSENMGSLFVVTFPFKAFPKEDKESIFADDESVMAMPSEVVHAPAEKNVLLLAEDDDDMREYLMENLSKEYEVISVSDGAKALEMAREINPDIIISDVIMPGLEGDEMCRILKSSMETSHIPIILLTALSERENVIAGLEAGANDYILKPFDFSVLRIRIRNTLLNRQHLRETVLSSDSAPDETDYTSQLDKIFLDKAIEAINNEMSNTEFSINDFCRVLGMSRTSVYNKLKTLTDQSPNDFIRIIRLNKARELLASKRHAIAEVACMVGFSDPKYFSTCFKKQFGISPSKV